MNELFYVYAIVGLMVGMFSIQVLTGKFDPFAPIWLFFVGYAQLYVIQAISYHEWALGVRGVDVVGQANFRAFWALAWFILIYQFGPGGSLAKLLPSPPARWLTGPVQMLCPALILWGLICSGLVLRSSDDSNSTPSAEAGLFLSFPMVMLVGGVLLIVTGRQIARPRPAYVAAGVSVVAAYLIIWMFNGKRSHSLVAVLVGVCSFYLPRLKRPTFPILAITALVGALAVGISIGWRYYANQHGTYGSFSKFIDFVTTFNPETILESLNMGKETASSSSVKISHETEEYGGFLLMIDTVPAKADYDYGVNYLRIFSTYIPRIIWTDKPLFGREQWIAAWIAGSELKRDTNFTGPAIGILGAAQLNGGPWGTLIVMGCAGLLLKTGYEYFRRHDAVPWVQVWWPLTYYNAWMMTAGDDPLTWFYYNYSFTTIPPLFVFWCMNKYFAGPGSDPLAA